ncbi:DUF1501 domain-containing protein [Vitreimonas flagellata]|uniref:DUF1501 domain-containing protein n=1 Tax=Vitreimonas flagellata TaxID=2560861 RepID=UPI001EF77B30|nr:DUF1501 domain-containing protein [Vitreimonas flagellata]
MLNRRTLLAGAAGAGALSFPAFAFGQAQATDKRLLVVVLRGGLDGLSAIAPIGDPAYAGLRGRLAIARSAALPLDSTFALHPNLSKMHALYRAGELLPIHACATAYRERSHFDAQNVLETGGVRPFARTEGWLNKALGALPRSRPEMGMALSAQAPLILRGPTPVSTWSPSTLPDVNTDTMARMLALYEARDPALANALESAMSANAVAMESGAGDMNRVGPRAITPLAQIAARFLKDENGPIAAVMDVGGWDTHANQGLEQGPLARGLTSLDDGLDAFKTEMGPAWANTMVIIATEFGRTAAPNGANGTDHGTGAAAFLAGGAVRGGRVLADWPGLSRGALYEERDLRPTTDLRAVFKGVLADHLRVASTALERDAFPDSAAARAMQGLISA